MYRSYPLSFDKPYKQTADNRSMFPYMSRSFFALFFLFSLSVFSLLSVWVFRHQVSCRSWSVHRAWHIWMTSKSHDFKPCGRYTSFFVCPYVLRMIRKSRKAPWILRFSKSLLRHLKLKFYVSNSRTINPISPSFSARVFPTHFILFNWHFFLPFSSPCFLWKSFPKFCPNLFPNLSRMTPLLDCQICICHSCIYTFSILSLFLFSFQKQIVENPHSLQTSFRQVHRNIYSIIFFNHFSQINPWQLSRSETKNTSIDQEWRFYLW